MQISRINGITPNKRSQKNPSFKAKLTVSEIPSGLGKKRFFESLLNYLGKEAKAKAKANATVDMENNTIESSSDESISKLYLFLSTNGVNAKLTP